MTSLFARLRSLWRGLLRRGQLEAEMRDEFAAHIELRTEDLMHQGLSPEEAKRRAHLEFGHEETYRQEARVSRGLRLFDQIRFSWLDVKLGIRMLWKHPGLTIVSLFSLAVGIPVGMAPMHVARAFEASLPVPEGERVQAIRWWNVETSYVESPSYFDFTSWRDELSSFQALGAGRDDGYNVSFGSGPAEARSGAEITASVFDILRVRPLLGRPLTVADEAAGAAPVVVLGYDLWQTRMGADPDAVGKTLTIGDLRYMIVGVMPKGFLFPVRQELWLPLKAEVAADPGERLGLWVFGRLADGVTDKEAQSEVTAISERLSSEFPQTYTRLRAEVVSFPLGFVRFPRGGLRAIPEFYAFQALALLLLLVPCGNVAMLVFARTTTRSRELAVRTALGAGRLRVISQIFAESLVLALVAAGLGLLAVDSLLDHVVSWTGTRLPYWLDLGLTWEAVLWALMLAALCAIVSGVIPALRVTGRAVQQNIQKARSASSGARFGGVTTLLIVGDVAVAVVVAGFALGLSDMMRVAVTDKGLVGIPAEEFLAVQPRLPISESGSAVRVMDFAPYSARLAETQRALVERLESEPGVRSVGVANALPRMDHPSLQVQVEAPEEGGELRSRYIRTARVDVGYFQALDQPILSGRGLNTGDLGPDGAAVVVNTKFVEEMFSGRNPVGRRLRFTPSQGDTDPHWYEIVGVVGHLGVNVVEPGGASAIYVPAAPGEINPLRLAIHVTGDPESFAPRVREIITEIDPDAVIDMLSPLDRFIQSDWYLGLAATGGLTLLVLVLLMLVTSGLHAIMSFSVSERTPEIGIRTALGASRSAIASVVVRRALLQVGAGALIGTPLAAKLFLELRGWGDAAVSAGPATLGAFALGVAVTVLIGLFACTAPTLRALRIEPIDALTVE